MALIPKPENDSFNTTKKPSTKKVKPLKNVKRHPVKLADIAFGELSLPGSLNSRADEERLGRIRRGMEWLDEEVSRVRGTAMSLLSAYDRTKDVDQLVAGLRELAKIQDPEKAAQYEETVQKVRFGDALTMVSDHMEDVEDMDEAKIEALLELLTGKPTVITGRNPRKGWQDFAQAEMDRIVAKRSPT